MFSFWSNFLYYLVTLIIAAFFILLGILGIMLPWSTHIRDDFIEFILINGTTISLLGFASVVIGSTMLFQLWIGMRRHYYYIRVGGRSVAVDEAIIQHYIDAYWKQVFPNEEIPSRLVLKKNKIKIVADLPKMDTTARKELLQRIQEEIQEILVRVLGYPHEFILSLSFKN